MAKNSLIGQRFGMLEVIEEESRGKSVYCLCKCDCGTVKWIRRDHLKKDIRSCGCQSTSNREKAKREDLTGQKFGRLTVVEKTDKKDYLGTAIYKCRCDCGNLTEVNARALKIGNTRSCGCLKSEESKKRGLERKSKVFTMHDLTGQKFGMLTVLHATDEKRWGNVVWVCQCDCGNIVKFPANYLKSPKYKHDCGCVKRKKGGIKKMKNKIK